jgi:acyl-CoA thioesterase FadM
MTHRPERDGSTIASTHVPYFLALEVAADAWGRALTEACGDLLGPRDLALVHADCDFERELFIGEAEADVALVKVGSSSLSFTVEFAQGGRRAGRVNTVLSLVDEDRVHSVPLSEPQRVALNTLLRGAAG